MLLVPEKVYEVFLFNLEYSFTFIKVLFKWHACAIATCLHPISLNHRIYKVAENYFRKYIPLDNRLTSWPWHTRYWRRFLHIFVGVEVNYANSISRTLEEYNQERRSILPKGKWQMMTNTNFDTSTKWSIDRVEAILASDWACIFWLKISKQNKGYRKTNRFSRTLLTLRSANAISAKSVRLAMPFILPHCFINHVSSTSKKRMKFDFRKV